MAILSIIFVGMRFYTRHLKKAGFKWDDWLILTCLLTMLGTDILAICGSYSYNSFACHHQLGGVYLQ